jgi:hypothetical protein
VDLPQLSAHNSRVMPLFTSESCTRKSVKRVFTPLKRRELTEIQADRDAAVVGKGNGESHWPGPLDGSPARSFSEGIMTARNDRYNHEGILLPRVIECPVCGERAPSFRIRRVMDLRNVDGEFYHRTATCAGSMTPDMPAAMDLLRLAVEEAAKLSEPRVQIETLLGLVPSFTN